MGKRAVRRLSAIGAALCTSFGAAQVDASAAQPASPARPPIIVTGNRLPEPLDGVPLIDLIQRGDIAGYGDNSLADLLSDLNREDATGGESRPLILLNGRRIFNLSEVSDLPTESIARVEVYSAPGALRVGGSATQKVMNFVLREQYRSANASVVGGIATEGGGQNGDAAFSMSRISGNNRLSIAARAFGVKRLLESERGIHSTPTAVVASGNAIVIDEGRFRTLSPEQRRYSLNATIARQVSKDVNLSLNAGGSYDRNHSLYGLPNVNAVILDHHPLEQNVRNLGGYIALKANGDLGRWSLSATSEYGHRNTRTLTDQLLGQSRTSTTADDRLTDRARSRINTGGLVVVASGPLLMVPAGDVRLSLRGDLTRSSLDARLARTDFVATGQRDRTDAGAWLDAEVPITEQNNASPILFRGLSAHLNGGIRSVSDVRTLHSFGYAVSWAPLGGISVNASMKHDRQPPSLVQLASPVVATSGVRYFDYVRGQTVDLTEVSGGNPELEADRRKTLTISMNVLPFGPGPVRVSIDYKHYRIDDPVASLPAATGEIQAAFPERFVRDANGTLALLDSRLLTFEREKREQLHWGVLVRHALQRGAETKSPKEGRRSGTEDGTNGAEDGIGIRFSFNHTWYLKDEILLRRGFREIDLLHGGPNGNYGGQPQHVLEWELGAFGQGFGARLSGSWRSGTHVRGGPNATTDFLRFSPLMQHELRLFTDLGDRLPEAKWARGFRLSLMIANLLNQRQKVRDANGDTPLRYKPAYLDPFGRTVRLELRKLLD